MSVLTFPAPADASAIDPHMACLHALYERAERGDLPSIEEVRRLISAPDRTARGLAKRLLAYVLQKQAQRTSSVLLTDACADLDFVNLPVLRETLIQLLETEQWPQVTGLCLRAAERLTHAGAAATALVYLQNSVAIDAGHGSENLNAPEYLRQVLTVYALAARSLGAALDIRPGPRHRRRSSPSGKLRLAHVVCQIVDGGHAPSRSIETMLKFADRERFDTLLVVTEALGIHTQHDDQVFQSEASASRGRQRLQHIAGNLGVPILLPRTMDSFPIAAADLHAQMAEQQIDIAFFHGSAATPTDWLLCAWQAAPWQLDAGFGLPLYCPAVDFQYFEFEQAMDERAVFCRERGIPYGFNRGGADLTPIEQAEPLPRGELEIPADHAVLGTIGNHLANRMSSAFCRTVARVMRDRPKTTFLVVGGGDFAAQRAAFGDLCNAQGVPPRVRFMGPTAQPARFTRTFDIYLNSYPDGGGFALGDAMAAGVAVVAMTVGTSPLALAGAGWLGDENLVQPATDEAYAARLRQLIDDPAERRQFGQRLRERCLARFDARAWVQELNERIWQTVKSNPAPTES